MMGVKDVSCMRETTDAYNRGFLNEEYRLSHLKDNRAQEIEYHYHEFDKIVLFLSGKVSYIVEGKTYHLQPWDILFIRHNSIHKPMIDNTEIYERIVLWINEGLLDAHSFDGCDLSRCFDIAEKRRHVLFRPTVDERLKLGRMAEYLESSAMSQEFGSRLLARTYLLQLMVAFNRCLLDSDRPLDVSSFEVDPKIDLVLQYINAHLLGDLSIDSLSKRFYISRYHFMRRFKEATGYTIHSYVQQKRLGTAAELIKAGSNPTEAAGKAGFTDYSSFLRAFKQMYFVTPRQYQSSSQAPASDITD